MKTGLFKRIFVLYGILFLASALGAEVFIADAVRTHRIADLRSNLDVQARLLGRDIPFQANVPLDVLCRSFKETAGARVTVIAPDGKVLGDSDHDSSSMDNHANRIEVEQAALTGSGMTVRHSHTLGYDLLYVARQIVGNGRPLGFIRLSIPLKDVEAAVRALRIKILLAVATILLVTGLFSLWQIEHLRRLTISIRDFASSLAQGELGKRLFISRAGEFDEIAESLNAMSLELKQSLAATEEERNRLAVILSSIPDALLISDSRGTVRFASAASRIFFGDQQLSGKQFIEIVRNREFLALLDDVRQDRMSETAEFTLDRPEERHCAARVSPLSYREGEISGYVAVFHDITQIKKLEQVRKDFVANISHELKTPVTAIRGYAETLLQGALDDREHAAKFLETIKANSDRINSLIDDLMTISKIELGVIKVDKTDVAVQDAIDAVLALLGSKAADKKLSITVHISEGQGTIRADRDRLIQILTNLVDNAIKFTDKGGVSIGITQENGRPCLFVQDTGIGVPDKHLPRLGERFYRVDAARSRNMGGTGLGLAIVKHLVKAHGWDMQIESTAGKGTRVKIVIT